MDLKCKYKCLQNVNINACDGASHLGNTATSLKGRGPFGAIRPLRGLFEYPGYTRKYTSPAVVNDVVIEGVNSSGDK